MPDLTERLQQMLGQGYRITDELGAGAMSRVFVAQDVELGRDVVVKVLPPELAAGLNIDRFRREIQMAARLQHPHIIPLLSAGSRDGLLYYTMPRIEGESLRSRIARSGQLATGETVRFLRDVADALEHAHAHGVVHRDIKPDNILISGHHAFVTDFGVAKALSVATGELHLTSAGIAIGTPAYMSPEQASADPEMDHRTDIYSLGVLGYEMLSGCPPFSGATQQQILAAQVTSSPAPLSSRRVNAPAALADLIMRCLRKDPADRFQSAEDVREQLELTRTLIAEPALATAGVHIGVPQVKLRLEKNRKPRDDELDVYGLTHRGMVRAENQDHFMVGSLRSRLNVRQSSLVELSQIPLAEERVAFFAMVADGAGEGFKGEQASRLALEVVTRYIAEGARCYHRVVEEDIDLGQALEEGVKRCHQAIQERAAVDPTAAGMATTVTLFIGVWPWIYLAQAGNSRYYQYRDGILSQISRDQTVAPESADQGLMPRDLPHMSAQTNILSNAIGGQQAAPVVTRIRNSWWYIHLLCSDGLTRHVSDERIAKRLGSMHSARQVCEDLLQDALDAGGTDNITIVVGRAIAKD
jgi:serine/threonine protein kinase